MASATSSRFSTYAFRAAGLAGGGVLGVAYWQRLPPARDDHRLSWRESLSTRLYRNFVAPLVLQVDPETAHVLTLKGVSLLQSCRLLLGPGSAGSAPLDWLLHPSPSSVSSAGPSLRQELFAGKLKFETPVGIAAGFDKNAWLVPSYRLGLLHGLGFAEVGSVSARPAEGNVQPRCWRIPTDQAVVNFMGLNNEGADAVRARLGTEEFTRTASASSVPIGLNIAKTHSPEIVGQAAVEDFVYSFRTLAPMAEFVVLNVSCPNTAEGKTFEEPDTLADLLQAVAKERAQMEWPSRPPPILVKLVATPDSEEGRARQRQLLETIEASGIIDGLVISNTIPQAQAKLSATGRAVADEIGKGGLSGRPIHSRSVAAIRSAYQATGGRLPIIGVGGTDSAEAAYEKIRAGASLVEVYTGLVYKGPGLLVDINAGLRRFLERDGYRSVAEAVGVDAQA
eukprot:TRINITY_DN88393_c0_g1_i1.p1 TRINITY_DN88393_c0_g1~~TRINITY_DN88393_c0_g1_i1.p1  ORF type:complete len:452 (-),score=69.52 TRINITY_DN88393_c0_g1_i1:76-1431(-)